MCGIAGIVNLERGLGVKEMESLVRKMANKMAHRGPDDFGLWVDPEGFCALSHRRLSVIDTSKDGRQPMLSLDKKFCITFNGELYNYKELRKGLINRGYRFVTNTDTEVLLNALIKHGESAFKGLDGMYAFGFYDTNDRRLILGRDPFGEKPLYYMFHNGYFAFASEINALALLPKFDHVIDVNAIAEYLALQYVHAPRAIYHSVKKLEPGHFLKLSHHGATKKIKHFSFNPEIDYFENRSIEDRLDELDNILTRSIERRLISDVPIGAFLSGGIDSSLVVAIVSKVLGVKLETFSIGFSSTPDTEHLFSEKIARHLGTKHNVRILEPDVLNNIELIATSLDEPNGDNSCLPTFMLSEFAREKIIVALSGDGGDEMFGGYQRYVDTMKVEDKYKSDFQNKKWYPDKVYFDETGLLIFNENEIQYLLGHIPRETKQLLEKFKKHMLSLDNNLINKMRAIDARTYLPGAVLAKVDRMSMKHSLEVRTPYLSRDVARFAEKLKPEDCYRNGQSKYILKKLASRYLPREWLERGKMGFNFPMNRWAEVKLREATKNYLFDSNPCLSNWIDKNKMKNYINTEITKPYFNVAKLWNLLILELWLRNNEKISGQN